MNAQRQMPFGGTTSQVTSQKRRKARVPKRERASTGERFIRLSPTSGLNLYKECPRCFWLHHHENIKRPQGPFPSLPGGMDMVIKDYFDRYRGSLPPELQGKVDGKLMEDNALMNVWRNWRTGLGFKDTARNAELFGALDECLVIDGKYAPLDYKTRGSPPRPGDSERYYQTQLDSYTLMLRENGYPVADHGYLVYYFPKKVERNGVVHFEVYPVRMSIDANRAQAFFASAVDCLRGTAPQKHTGCLFCDWVTRLAEFD